MKTRQTAMTTTRSSISPTKGMKSGMMSMGDSTYSTLSSKSAFGQMETYPNIKGWVERFQARPAYAKALEKGGAYNLGPAK